MIEIVLCILLKDGMYVMQHRNDKKEIPNPGMWGLFGGQLELDEKPIAGIVREIKEELNVHVPEEKFENISSFSDYHDFYEEEINYHIFAADFTNFWGKHELFEGQGVACFTFAELNRLRVPEITLQILNDFHNAKIG